MNLETFLEQLDSGNLVVSGSEAPLFMHGISQEAQTITAEINGSYHTPEELQALFSQLIGQPVDDCFALFPPFHTDCGKDVWIGSNATVLPGATISTGSRKSGKLGYLGRCVCLGCPEG